MDGDDPVAEILGRWREEAERGRVIDPREVISAHPEHAEDLRARFEAEALLERYFLESPGPGPSPPEQLGDYRILREIGRGGMGVVYEAEQVSMRRRVALKVLFPSIATTDGTRRRFSREARVTGRLHHTNIVTVHQMGRQGGHLYFAMELVEGMALDRAIRRLRDAGASPLEDPLLARLRGRGSAERVAAAFAGVAEALEAAHDQGVVHRDVKPSNLILDASGRLKLTDFGLAHFAGDAACVTQSGERLGTPLYMSPEQVRARRGSVDARTDVYSLGATLYEALTLCPPYDGEDALALCSQVLAEDPVPPRHRDPAIPGDLEAIVEKAMEKEREARYASAGDLARDLRAFAEGRAIAARRVGPLGRAWRLVKRQRVRSALVAALVCALGAAGTLGALGSRAEGERTAADSRRREIEYLSICASAEDAFYRRTDHAQGPTSSDLFARAMILLPGRYEAYLGRVLCEGSWEGTLADVEAAAARGAPGRAVHLARAWAFRGLGRELDAAAEEKAADGYPADDLRARLLEAWLTANRGDFERSLPVLDSIIEEAPHGSAVRYLARRARCVLRLTRGDAPGAMTDIHALQEEGDRSPELVVGMAGVWRRLGHADAADGLLAGLFEKHRAVGTLDAWTRLCALYSDGLEWSWLGKGAEAGLASYPESGLLAAHRGWSLLKANRLDEAMTLASRAVQLDPGRHEAQALLGHVHERRGEYESAAEALQRATALEPRCAGCPAGLADVLRSLRRFPEAMAAADEAVRRRPRDPVGQAARAKVFQSMGKPADALAAADRALSLDPREYRALMVRGWALSEQGCRDDALVAFDRAARAVPGSGAAHRMKGVTLHAAGKLAEALAELDRALEIDPRDADAHGKRGVVLDDMGRVQEAADELARAEGLDPKEAEYPVNLGFACLELNHPGEALMAEDRAVALDPSDALAHGHRAAALLLLGRFGDAVAAADRAIALDASLAEPLWRRAMALGRLPDRDAATHALESAAKRDPRGGELVPLLGWLRAAGQEAETRSVLLAAIDRGFARGALANPVAWWLVERAGGEPAAARRAVALVEAASAAAPEDGALWNTLGVARYRAGNDRGAVDALERSVRLTKGGAWDFLFLAMARQRLGEHEEALRSYLRGLESCKEALARDPSLAAAKAEAERLLGVRPGVGVPGN